MKEKTYPHGLSTADVAERAGVEPATIRDYLYRARLRRARNRRERVEDGPWLLPEPDIVLSRESRWSLTLIEAWEAARPGRGARTDLLKPVPEETQCH